ncbi:MAG: CHAT domain-containing tetratricopeptide repeat protein, partial [Pyrinomonadaceae bacterium]
PRLVLLSQLVRGESERCSGKMIAAENTFREVFRHAAREEHPQIAWIAANALGLVAKKQNDFPRAENYFRKAVEIIESLRSPLAADEFRTAFFTDKLAPYQNLADICRHEESRISESFVWIERARSQSLLDLLADSNHQEILLDDASLQTKLDHLREKLNWFYNRLTRPISEIGAAESEIENIQDEIRRHENEINALILHSQATRENFVRRGNNFDLGQLQKALGKKRVLIEFAEFDGRFAAFIIGETSVKLIEKLGSAPEIQAVLEQLHFQFATLRYGTANLQKHLSLLKKRADHLLQTLYNLLLLPLEDLIAEKHLIIVPAKNLHYVPFQALRRGEKYLIENCEVSFAPSATVLQNLLQRDSKVIKKVLAVGFADERVPQVEHEVENLANVLPHTTVLAGASATFAAVRETLQNEFFNLLHLACHGQFRAENPLFSSLHLADGWVTVREVAKLRLENALVVLSACETGLSQIAAGEELLGLIRGFLAAGANTLIISLWTVNDAATADLIGNFYQNLKSESSLTASLRAAQIKFIEQDAHPYLWAPFILTGRW